MKTLVVIDAENVPSNEAIAYLKAVRRQEPKAKAIAAGNNNSLMPYILFKGKGVKVYPAYAGKNSADMVLTVKIVEKAMLSFIKGKPLRQVYLLSTDRDYFPVIDFLITRGIKTTMVVKHNANLEHFEKELGQLVNDSRLFSIDRYFGSATFAGEIAAETEFMDWPEDIPEQFQEEAAKNRAIKLNFEGTLNKGVVPYFDGISRGLFASMLRNQGLIGTTTKLIGVLEYNDLELVNDRVYRKNSKLDEDNLIW